MNCCHCAKLLQYADNLKQDLLHFLHEQQQHGKKVMAYGAAAKGNTLLNYAGVIADLLPAVFDAAESKQGKYLPGSHIPVYAPERLQQLRPDYLLILPWNIADEVIQQQAVIRQWEGQFLTAIPELRVAS